MQMRWFYAVAAFVTLLCALGAAYQTFSRPISPDEAYNFQVAKSISTTFCYCTRYHPERVFPVEESVNGLVQYIAAGFLWLTHSPDDARAGTVAVGVIVLGTVLLLWDPWLVFLALGLYFVWPWFHVTVTSFGGEVLAIAFSLFGLFLLRRGATLIAIICFGIALESKLISIIVIMPAAWAYLYAKDASVSLAIRAYRATRDALIVAFGAAAVLFALIALSIAHSTAGADIAMIWQTYTGYILNMIGQGQRATSATDVAHAAQAIAQFESPIVLALFAVAAAVLLVSNPGYAIFIFATLVWWLYYGKTERHLVISFFATLAIAGFEGHALLDRLAPRFGVRAFALSLGSLAALIAVAVGVGIATHSSFNVAPPNRFSDREHVVSTSIGHMVYSEQLVEALRRHRYVLTSGWWQFAEISLRENMEFYDRTSPSNAAVPRDDAVLFFDRGIRWSPITTVSGNCERVVYSEGPLVVCTPRRDKPLAFQPTASP